MMQNEADMLGRKDITPYLNDGVEKLIADIIKSTFQNPKETKFLLDHQNKKRINLQKHNKFETEGFHVPAFLISSISNACNLFCKGCYARINGICGDQNSRELLTAEQWSEVFNQAAALGVSFNLLASGEHDGVRALFEHEDIVKACLSSQIHLNDMVSI